MAAGPFGTPVSVVGPTRRTSVYHRTSDPTARRLISGDRARSNAPCMPGEQESMVREVYSRTAAEPFRRRPFSAANYEVRRVYDNGARTRPRQRTECGARQRRNRRRAFRECPRRPSVRHDA